MHGAVALQVAAAECTADPAAHVQSCAECTADPAAHVQNAEDTGERAVRHILYGFNSMYMYKNIS
jgi:hypothetical protein